MVDVDLTQLLLSLEDEAQCPVCLKLFKPPVTVCVNGHGVCTLCRGSLSKCPTCRDPFSSTEPRILNKILQKIPKICKYHDKGCRFPATEDHEVYCKFRTVKCFFPLNDEGGSCDWAGIARDWSTSHLEFCNEASEISHKGLYSADIENNTFTIQNCLNIICTGLIYNFETIEGSNEPRHFILYFKRVNGNYCIYIKYLPLEKPTVVTFFTISLTNSKDQILYMYKMKATPMVSLEDKVKVEENVYCMWVPVEELEALVDEEGSLLVFYEIETEPI